MKHFIPTNRIPSAHAAVENSGQVIKVKKNTGWGRRVSAQVAINIAAEAHARALRGLHS
jgi:hypothetical protein